MTELVEYMKDPDHVRVQVNEEEDALPKFSPEKIKVKFAKSRNSKPNDPDDIVVYVV